MRNVYVVLSEHNGMVDMMSNLEYRGLLATGDYVVIHVDLDTFSNVIPLKYFRRTYDSHWWAGNVDAARSLLVIVSSPPSNPKYDQFHAYVNSYNEQRPFGFPNPFNLPKKISVYAAYLYDSVLLYARALDEVLKALGTSGATNGREIFNHIKGRSYMSIQGFMSYIDENGDAEGNYTLLARMPFESQYGNYSMLPVGHFQVCRDHSGLPTFNMFEDGYIDWPRKRTPLDEPLCGYRGDKCVPVKNYTLEIVFGSIGGLLFMCAVVGLIMYRNWKYEQEIAGLSWRISVEDIQGLSTHKSIIYGSKVTVASQASIESRISLAQVYTMAGTYRGQLVALKRYTRRHLDLTRQMKKEMKMMKDLRHDNVNAFVGASIDGSDMTIVTEYCSKGSLQDILENDDVKLDTMFSASLIMDLIKGMTFLHDRELRTHGNLKSSNCVVNSRWTLQVTDFGLSELRRRAEAELSEYARYRNRLWTAPELLRACSAPWRGTQKGDVYAFGIILYEIVGRTGPYGDTVRSPRELVEAVMRPTCGELCRPGTAVLECQDYLINCMQDCWAESPEFRPDFPTIRSRLKPMRDGMKPNIFDNIMSMMEKYQDNLEDLVAERTGQLVEEKKKTEGLLHRMLPKSVADQLIRGSPVVPETFECVTIFFSDICGFTALSAESTPMEVVNMLNDLYTLFDSIINHYDVYKVETIGDAYMVVSGLPIRNGNNHAGEIASLSLHLIRAMQTFRIRHRPNELLKLRIGVHSGPCVAGVVGLTMPRYCLFGDTVNTCSRMEAYGEALKVHASGQFKTVIDKLGGYVMEPRGNVYMKGKGRVFTYWLTKEDCSVRLARINRSTIAAKGPQSVPAHRKWTAGNNGHAVGNCHYLLDGDGVQTSSSLSSVWGRCVRPRANSTDLLGNCGRRAVDGPALLSRDFAGLNGVHSNCARAPVEKIAEAPHEKADLRIITVFNSPSDRDNHDVTAARENDRLLDSGVSSETSGTPPSRRCPGIGVARRTGRPARQVSFENSPIDGIIRDAIKQRRCSSETNL
ncbi:Receptor-type guanylate cyclase Gyc76C [Lamellibrachia satsuma]|nr:Receptor-type guanylate cyclase Gyc76C [Lamellibrachia satsuma]